MATTVADQTVTNEINRRGEMALGAMQPRAALAAAVALAGGWAALFSWLAVQRFLAGGAHAEDLGFTDQVLANFLRGQWFRMSIYQGASWNTELDISRLARPDSLLAFHFEPLLLGLVPLYALGGGVISLLVVQALAVAAGTVPAFRVAQHATHSQLAALAVAIAYLLSPLGQSAVLADVHTVTLAGPLLLLAVERLLVGRKPWQAVTCALLAAAAREDVGLLVAALGVVLSWRTTYRPTGLLLIGGGVACTLIGLLVIRGYSGGSPFDVRYGETLGGGFTTAISALTRPAVLGYAATVAASGAWLGLLSPLALLPMVPSLALNVFSTSPWMMAGKAHYSALVLPLVALAAAAGLRRLRYHAQVLLAASATLVVSSAVVYASEGSGPLGGNFALPRVDAHAQRAGEIAATLPPDAAVSASTALVSRVSQRQRIYVFPAVNNADFVYLDLTSSPAPTSAGDVYLRTRALVEQGGWQVEAADDGLLLLRRLDAAGPTDIGDVALAVRAAPTPPDSEPPAALGTYADGRVSLLSAALLASPTGAIDVDGPLGILRTSWRSNAPLSAATRLEFAITLRDGRQLQRWDIADLWWSSPHNWAVGETVTVDISDIPVRQFLSWQATYRQANP
ncbi:MAG TPA: DUF2079 domain-containing protein [Chloroflexota bacterium]|jgi:uncharacterized membrane protein|nr:DUF2079 domain-containing protein [Chloroflexota bacterium]